MKFRDLKILISFEMENVKKNKQLATRFILMAYNKVLSAISDTYSDSDVVSAKKIDELSVTQHMKEKLKNMLNTKLSKKEKASLKTASLRMDLTNLLGIGDKKVSKLIELGLTTIKQLNRPKWFNMLNKDTQLILTYKPLRKIPRRDIQKIESKLTEFVDSSGVKIKQIYKPIITGSYRRRKPFSKDIDVLVASDDEKYLDRYVEYLNKKFFKKVYSYSHGSDKVSLVLQPFKNNSKKHFKVDIFRANVDTYYSNLLYSTGSREFNIRTRAIAKKNGYLLNQNGLFKATPSTSTLKKINKPTDDERKLFEYLNIQYLPPDKR